MTSTGKAATLKNAFELFLISMLGLYFELMVIRWVSSEIRIFAYFKNMPLMAALFGLGLGLALTRSKRKFSDWFPVCILIITTLVCFAEPLHLVYVSFLDPFEHYIIGFILLANWTSSLGSLVVGWMILAAIFYLIVFTFACLGQVLGELFDRFQPLAAYSINVAASLAGIALFSVVSFLSWPPAAWLLLGGIMSLYFFRKPLHVICLLAAMVIAAVTAPPNVLWTPYYRVSVDKAWIGPDGNFPPVDYGTNISVNHDFQEGAWDMRPESLATLSPLQRAQTGIYYELLYQALGDKPRETLILASGTGNDVAMALRHGATYIDAVDIDPSMIGLGKMLHVERPYDNPRVHAIAEDARAFLRQTHRKYDLVDFAYLDSQSTFSSMSSIRLDNFVYTVESFRDAARLLKPDGVMSVTTFTTRSWQAARLYKALTLVFGKEPVGMYSYTRKHLTFLAGPGVDAQRIRKTGVLMLDPQEFKDSVNKEGTSWDQVEPTTDDWPFFFLHHRGLTLTYTAGLLLTLLVGWWLVGRCFGKSGGNPMGRTMFFLGAAFMLVEVKTVQQLGLLLGTTWLVNTAAIGAILLMILIANLAVIRFQFKSINIFYALLIGSLFLSYFFPVSMLNELPFGTRAAIGSLVLSVPVAFAGVIFAVTFKRVPNPHVALGMNLIGTLVGGALEYLCMVFGTAALNLMAVILYGLAWYFWRICCRSPEELPDIAEDRPATEAIEHA